MPWLENILNRLATHFQQVVVRGPASPEAVRRLLSTVPEVPEDLLQFFYRCDGVGAGLEDRVVGQLYSIKQAVARFPVAQHPEVARRFFPVRGDGCGNYDCVVVGPGTAEGAVVFWDHEVYEGAAYLLGGTFASFFEMLADHLVTRYFPDGREDPRYRVPRLETWPWTGEAEREHPWPFEERWIRAHDRRAAELLSNTTSRNWLLRQDP